MSQFTVNSDNIDSQLCQFIAPFNNNKFVIAGVSTLDDSTPCLLYAQVYPLYNWNFGWYDTQKISMYDTRSQQVLPNGLDVAMPGQVCAPPHYIYNPFRHSLYDPLAEKAVSINSTVCDSSDICSTPQDDQNETQAETTYNASTHKLVAIDATVCNSSEICSLPIDDNIVSAPEECTPYDKSFYTGLGIGVASTVLFFLTGIVIYCYCHKHKGTYNPAATFERDATEFAASATTDGNVLVDTPPGEESVHV